jgi:hypothetical protein
LARLHHVVALLPLWAFSPADSAAAPLLSKLLSSLLSSPLVALLSITAVADEAALEAGSTAGGRPVVCAAELSPAIAVVRLLRSRRW